MSRAPTTSNVVLTARFGPVKVGASTCSRGRPATGRVRIRGPATWVIPGASTSPIPVPSSSQPSRRRPSAPSRHEPEHATTSAPSRSATWAAWCSVPSDRHARDRVGAVGATGPDDRVARLRDVAERGDEPGEVSAVADDDHRVAEPALGPLGAEPPAPDPPGEEEPGQPERQRDEEEPTSELQLEQVADDGQGREQAHGGRGDRAVLLRAVAEEPRVVGVVHAQRHQPEHDEDDGDHGVVQPERRRLRSVRVAGGRAEPHQLRADDRPDDDERVGDRDPERVPLDAAAGAGRRPSDRRGHPARASGSRELRRSGAGRRCGTDQGHGRRPTRHARSPRSHNRPATTPTIPTANQTVIRTALPTTTSTPSRYSRCRVANHRSGPPRYALPLKSGFPPNARHRRTSDRVRAVAVGETTGLPGSPRLHCPGDRPRRPDEAVGRRVGGRVRGRCRRRLREGGDLAGPQAHQARPHRRAGAAPGARSPRSPATASTSATWSASNVQTENLLPALTPGPAGRQARRAGPHRARRDAGHRQGPELPVHRLRRRPGPRRRSRGRHHAGPHPRGPAQRHADPLPA